MHNVALGMSWKVYSVEDIADIPQVAITSPDPEFNTDAKQYFTRHMRMLENCTSSWPMPEMQAQIDALRQAFSANINRPFEMKSSFPYGSPSVRLQPSPPADIHYQDRTLSRENSGEQAPRTHFNPGPITPPISAGDGDSGDGSLAAASLTMMATGQQKHQQMPENSIGTEGIGWNPTRIFEYGAKTPTIKSKIVRSFAKARNSQWNTAFGTPSSTITAAANSVAQQSPTVYTPSSVSSHDLPHLHDAMQQQQQFALNPSVSPLVQTQHSQPSSYTSAGPSYVSPSMWQDTVASTYDLAGLKRRWDMGSAYYNEPVQVKRPR